jgi:hypothetical protein
MRHDGIPFALDFTPEPRRTGAVLVEAAALAIPQDHDFTSP